MFKTTRRGFMIGCSAAIASMTGGLSFTAFGNAEAEPNQDILVVVPLREIGGDVKRHLTRRTP